MIIKESELKIQRSKNENNIKSEIKLITNKEK